jgi:hypothetical protein
LIIEFFAMKMIDYLSVVGIRSVKKGRVAVKDHPLGAEFRFSIDRIRSEAPPLY